MRPLAFAFALALFAAPALALFAAPALAQPLGLPDGPPYVLTGATIYTVDRANPTAEALAVGAMGEVVAVGTEADVLAAYPDWPRASAEGRAVIPGLIDAHGHLMGFGETLLQADLVEAASIEEIVERLRQFADGLPEGAWLVGRGWDQNDWPAQPDGSHPFPTRADLDSAFPNRPVALTRIDGHALWANTAAMVAAGLDPETPAPADPEDGQFLRDDRGRPTGVFVDAAELVVTDAIPTLSAETRAEALTRALAETARHGLTGVHEAGIPIALLPLYERLITEGRFPIRNYAMLSMDQLGTFCKAYPEGYEGNARLRVQSLKVYSDGALGSRGAALLADYSDDPGNTGLLFQNTETLTRTVTQAMNCGLQVNSHAIGDRGNRAVLDAYEAAMETTGGGLGRHRIEHAQVMSLPDIERMARLGIIASVQPTHATSDMPWAEMRVGPERIKGAYAWRRIVDAGARIALGSDFPVERVAPLLGFHAAVTRQDAEMNPAGGWYGNQVLSREEALRGFTLDAAYAGFMEDEVGSLEPGKRADFVILSQDLMRVPPEEILATEVLATVIDGTPVFVAE
ncbi:MAG: amidohydrolase [Bacteroidota bacterium]